MKITQTSNAVGAEVTGVQLKDLDDAGVRELMAAFADNGALFIRDQALAPQDQIALAERFGPININRFFRPVDGHPQIAEVLKEPDQRQNIGGGWHTDHSYDDIPARCSLLYAIDVPACGGDTLFAGMGAAFDALSPTFQALLRTLQAEHSSRHVFGAAGAAAAEIGDRLGNADAAMQDAVHPVVVAHPDTGRPLLYVNPAFTRKIVGWHDSESDMLLQFLYQHAMQPEFHTRLQWQPGTLAIWDNRATWHYALNDYHGQRRYLHRVTVEGVPLSAAA